MPKPKLNKIWQLLYGLLMVEIKDFARSICF